jgi:superfamily II helicase
MHGVENDLCESCLQMKNYAEQRTEKCRFGKDKPICANCPVHCYKPEMRQKIREVMRYSGPRMLTKHPFLAIMHFVDKKRFKQ